VLDAALEFLQSGVVNRSVVWGRAWGLQGARLDTLDITASFAASGGQRTRRGILEPLLVVPSIGVSVGVDDVARDPRACVHDAGPRPGCSTG
jgi:hypothetical protein